MATLTASKRRKSLSRRRKARESALLSASDADFKKEMEESYSLLNSVLKRRT